jgi:hypothetical protein
MSRHTVNVRRRRNEPAQDLDPKTVAGIHEALRLIAGSCDGARSRDRSGFSCFDAALGASLARAASLTQRQAAAAQRLVRKYRRQLDPATLAYAGVYDSN